MSEIKIACFGTNGHQIFAHLPSLKRARLVGVADVPVEKLDELRAGYPEAFAHAVRYENLEELLEGSGADLASICSRRRDRQHEDVVRALVSGAHVYAEKPLATALSGLEAVRGAAERTGREVRSMTGMMYSETFREMRRLVASGALGTVVQVFAQKSYPYHDGRPQDTGVDGGLIMQATVHAVSIVRYVTGLEFEEVFATETGLGNPRSGDLRMAAQIAARMGGGTLCTIVGNYCNPPGIGFWGDDRLRIHGTAGMAESVDGGTRTCLSLGNGKPTELPRSAGDSGYPSLLQDYVDHLLAPEAGNGSAMLLSQEDSLMNTRVVIRAQESAECGRSLKV